MLGIFIQGKSQSRKASGIHQIHRWEIQVANEREPGILRFDHYQDPADDNAFFVCEAYQDKKAFEEHQKTLPYQQGESQIKPEMVADFQPLFDSNGVCSVRPRRATAFGAARHWRFAGGALTLPLTKGDPIPFGNPGFKGLRAP